MKQRLSLFALALMLTISGCTKSGKLYSLSSLEELSPSSKPVDLAAYEAKYGEFDGVFLLSEDVIEHAGGKEVGALGALFNQPSTWLYQQITRNRYIVFNPRADWLTSFDIWTKPDDLYLRIINPDGTKKEYGIADLRAEKDSYGGEDYRFIFPDVKRGSIIETGYTIEFKVSGTAYGMPPLDHMIPLQFTVPIEEEYFTFACPDWWKYQVKKNGENQLPLIEIESDSTTKKSMIKVVRKDVPAVKAERYAPYFKESADYLQFQVTDLMMGGATYKAPETWQKIEKNLLDHRLKKLDNRTPLVKEQTRKVIGTSEKAIDKVKRIMTFASDSIENNYGNRNGNPDKVLKDRKADSFDLTALVSAMLTEVGLPNDLLLVHSARSGYCDVEYISLDQFNYPAVGCDIEGEYLILFPYLEGLPAGVIPPWFLGQPAVALGRTEIRFVTLPEIDQIPSGVNETYDLMIEDNGLIKVREERQLTGANAFLMRVSLNELPQTELKDSVKNMLTYTTGDIDLKSFEVINLDDPYEPLRLTYEYTIDNLVMITPQEVIFQTAGLFSPISGSKLIDDPKERINKVVVEYPEEYHKTMRVRYPENWVVATPLNNVEVINDFGTMSGQFELNSGIITVDQGVRFNRIRRPKEEYGEFLKVAGHGNELAIPTIVFTISEESTTKIPPGSDAGN